jgi:predicted ArsR family transcriptional regulator
MYITTQYRVLKLIRDKGSISVKELCSTLGKKRATIHHHLNLLRNQGLVESFNKYDEVRGRPELLFQISGSVFTEGVIRLSSALLGDLVSDLGQSEGGFKNKIKDIADRLIGEEIIPYSGAISMRLEKAVRKLNQMDYKPHWEASARGPLILLGCCPYRALLPQHGIICEVDRYLISRMIGMEAVCLHNLAKGNKSKGPCQFILTQ